MEKMTKLPVIVVLVLLIMFSITACGKDDNEDNTDVIPPSPHLGTLFQIQDAQVWKHTNIFPLKIKEAYTPFEESCTITVAVLFLDEEGYYWEIVDTITGELKNGILNIEGGAPLKAELLDWDDWKINFSEWDNLAIDKNVKGNVIRIYAGDSYSNYLNKEKLSGTIDSLWLESILLMYVEEDCLVTGVHGKKGYKLGDSYYESAADLDLSLKKGWNTLCRKQAYVGEFGSEFLTIEVKNPDDFIWVIYLK